MITLVHDDLLRRLEAEGCTPEFHGAATSEASSGGFTTLAWDDRRGPEADRALFVAIAGERHDSHDSLPRLHEQGYAAFVGERPAPVDFTAPYYRVSDARRALAVLCQTFAGDPGKRLDLFGITGTNGKSTTVRILSSILEAERSDRPVGWMSTVTCNLGDSDRGSEMTTPEPNLIAQGLAEFALRGGRRFVLEVSSHALDQGRTAGLTFAGGLLTNVTRDHFDYHGNFDTYLDAKLRLFEQVRPGGAVVLPVCDRIPADHARLKAAVERHGVEPWRFGLAPTKGLDGSVIESKLDAHGLSARLRVRDEEITVACELVGRHNLENVLAAVTLAVAAGVDPAAIRRGVASTPAVRGRLEPVTDGVYVDYAHTPEALRAVLTAARELTAGRLHVVFGCGGDRDRGKRSEMGAIATKLADHAIVTSDNPRTEDPERIIDDIRDGIETDGVDVTIEPDRAAAIALALRERAPEDVVVVAGKGHETYQEIGNERFDFDDAAVVRRVLEERSRA